VQISPASLRKPDQAIRFNVIGKFRNQYTVSCGPGSSVGISTGYGLGGPGIESSCGRGFPQLSIPTLGPILLYNGYRVFPGGKERPGRDADPLPPSNAVVMKG
jgi:hypothetical protein